MAWPFTSAPAPTFDSGIFTLAATTTAVPNTSGATPVYVMGMIFCNANSAPVQLTVTDNAGAKLMDAITIQDNGVFQTSMGYAPFLGIKVFASTATGVTGKVWGYI